MRPPPPTDHPRSRGEYSVHVLRPNAGEGSSPLSRGIRNRNAASTRRDGIIPALAGNTDGPLISVFMRRDHPRSRGEYWVQDGPYDRIYGSSPLSRGIRP